MIAANRFILLSVAGLALVAACDCSDDAPPGGADSGVDASNDGATADAMQDTGPVCTAEECNGLDDDCDGAIDEELVRACGTDVGECTAGTETCVDAAWGECVGSTDPTDEACNGIDEDCDGTIDEDLLMTLAGDRRLTMDPLPDDYVAVGWSGTGFGVVWSRGTTMRELWFRGLDQYGVPTSDAVRITTGADDVAAHLVWNDAVGEFGVVFTRDENEIRFVRVQADGTVPAADVLVAGDVSTRSTPWIDWSGTAYGVTWHAWVPADADLEVFAAVLAPDGSVTETLRITDADGDSRYANVRWNGSAWGLVWADDREGSERVYYARMSADGTAEEIGDRPISEEGAQARWPNIDLGAGEFGLTWHGGDGADNDVFFATIDFDGAVLTAPVAVSAATGAQEFASINWTGTQYVIAWQDARGGSFDAYVAFAGADGSVGGEHPVTEEAGNSQFVTAIWTGAHYGVGWRDDRDGDNEIYFTYVGCP